MTASHGGASGHYDRLHEIAFDYAFILWHTCLFFNATATTEIYTLSLHDALPIFMGEAAKQFRRVNGYLHLPALRVALEDRKSTRLNSSHVAISYAVFCLKKK